MGLDGVVYCTLPHVFHVSHAPQCPGGTFTPGLRSTKEFSDEAVNFVRAHPLMYHPIYPLHKRPLVVRTGVDYRFTTIAVDLVDAADGRYEVLFLGTGTVYHFATFLCIRLGHHTWRSPHTPGRFTQSMALVISRSGHSSEGDRASQRPELH